MGNDDGPVGLKFSETMSGYVAEGIEAFENGEEIGETLNARLSFSVTITIESVDDFCNLSDREAALKGTVSYPPLGRNLPVSNGRFSLFRPDAETGKRHMTYSFGFTGMDGNAYFLHGYKVISDDSGLDAVEDMTKLFTRIYRGSAGSSPLYGSGIAHFRIQNLPSMLASFEVTGTHSIIDKMVAVKKFFAFCYGELRDTYLAKLSPIYHADYENLVLAGQLQQGSDGPLDFFFFSGVHDKDFPWGDGEVFWDIGLVIRCADGWERYALTDRTIENFHVDVRDGTYRYTGPLFRIMDGNQVSYSELKRSLIPAHLHKIDVHIELAFDVDEYEPVDVPFLFASNYRRIVPRAHAGKIEELLPHLRLLGWHMGPLNLRITRGTITIGEGGGSERDYAIIAQSTRGEAEHSIIDNIRWPKIYYNYFCAISPTGGRTRVQVRSDVLRENRQEHLVDETLREIGKIINHVAFLDLLIDEHGCQVLPHEQTKPLQVVDDAVLEINNDHFPTAVFQRRVVAVQDDRGEAFLAMEEDMDPLNLGSINSERVVTVAALKGEDKFRALDAVLEASGFFTVLDDAWVRSGKEKSNFSIIVKPNFMFMYNVKDISTYTDPELVEYLIRRMHERGYRNLAVAEARSTYGVFYTNREVATVARHIGYSEENYRVIDLSLDLEPHAFSGTLGAHYVNREWKAADFRISFAKNKTHVYALYTLTLKCIYGALPMEDKFGEYHHDRDIFKTTIEFLKHFPAHFAFIDAFVSSDGPFGVFADTEPNHTKTIIGSESLVAADWIGAAKMGLNPMESDYMKEAVAVFGKPQIRLTGDRTIYPDWVNVGDVLPWSALNVIDRDYYFGNLFYSVMSYMEPFFQYKEESVARRLGKVLASPIQKLFFQTAGKGEFDAELNKTLWRQFTGNGQS
jgi:uncharacterized protein (DUF362 family)